MERSARFAEYLGNLGNLENLKGGKPQSGEERFDSGVESLKDGVESLKDDECGSLVEDMDSLDVSHRGENSHEEWKREVTEDGDT